jgi:putative acetyltransferase
MITLKRTNSDDANFRKLVQLLDLDLQERDGEEHLFYAELNKTDSLKTVVVAYENDEAIACGAIREYSKESMEVKRMFVSPLQRGKGIASKILTELEIWCVELGYKKCVLETGKNQPEAISLYKKNHYQLVPNFGKYKGVENSVCFEKEL